MALRRTIKRETGMRRWVILGLIAVIWSGAAAAAQTARTLTVTGSGEVAAVPDMAVLTIGVSAEAPAAEGAVRQVSKALNTLLGQLATAQIAERDVQTSTLTLQPVYDQDRQSGVRTQRGFLARSVLTVRVRDLAGLGGVLDAAVAGGATQFGGLRFDVSDPQPAEAQARAAAVADAARKAAQIADAAGVSLGAVQTITEQDFGGRPMGLEMTAARSAADVPVAAGEVVTRVQVTAVYAIE